MSVQRPFVVMYSHNAKTAKYAYPIDAIASLISSAALQCSRYRRRRLQPDLKAVKAQPDVPCIGRLCTDGVALGESRGIARTHSLAVSYSEWTLVIELMLLLDRNFPIPGIHPPRCKSELEVRYPPCVHLLRVSELSGGSSSLLTACAAEEIGVCVSSSA